MKNANRNWPSSDFPRLGFFIYNKAIESGSSSIGGQGKFKIIMTFGFNEYRIKNS
jgi:hypothetical protein